MANELFLRLLGIPELVDLAGNEVKLRSVKHLGLLVYLRLEARVKPAYREKLVEFFWPESGNNGLHSLSQALTDIRKFVGKDGVVGARQRVELRAHILTDLDDRDFSALPLPIPIPFEGMEAYGGPQFAHWVDLKRDVVLAQIESELSVRLNEAQAHGRTLEVRECAERLYSIDPYNQTAVNALIADRVDAGNWAGAARLFKKHIEDSKSDLGLAPSVATLAALERYERGIFEPALVREGAQGIRLEPERDARAFLGRESELARLQQIANLMSTGVYRSCLLRGPDGIGKSTLLRRFVSAASSFDRAPSYLVACQKMGERVPFAALSDLLDQLCRDPSLSHTHAVWLAEASRIAPGIKLLYKGVGDPPITQPDAVRVRLAEAIKQILAAVAEGKPVYLGFDDIQYMDPASRDVLHVLAHRLKGTATLIVAAVSRTESDIGAGPSLAAPGIEWHDTIDLAPLQGVQIDELIRGRSKGGEPPDGSVVQKIVEMADGLPLVAEMLLADWERSGESSLVMTSLNGADGHAEWSPPDSMRSAFNRQYEGLSKCGQRILGLLATAGRRMTLESCSRLLAEPTEVVGAAVFTLLERSIVFLDGNGLDFKNDIHRAYVYSTLPEETRKYHHAHLAQHLSELRDQSEFQYALEAAHHFLKAGWMDESRKLVCVGADRAISCGAPQEAEKTLEAVLAHSSHEQSMPIRLLQARSMCALGQFHQALTKLETWEPTAPTQLDHAHAECVRAEALHRGRFGDDAAIKKSLDRAISIGEQADDDGLFLGALQLCAEVASETGNSEELAAIHARTMRIATSTTNASTKALARLSQGYCLLVAGEPVEAENVFRSCVTPLAELRLDPELRKAYNGIGIATYCRGAFKDSISAFERAIEIASKIGNSVASATSWSNLGAVHEDLGNLVAADNCYASALELGEIAVNPRRAVEFHLNAASLKLTTRALDDAADAISVALGWADLSKLWWLRADVLLASADLKLATARPDEAWTLVKEAQGIMKERYYALANRGRYQRLRRHHNFATQGIRSLIKMSEVESVRDQCVQLTGRLEIRAFEDWARSQSNADSDKPGSAREELQNRGMLGVLERLDVLGYASGQMM